MKAHPIISDIDSCLLLPITIPSFLLLLLFDRKKIFQDISKILLIGRIIAWGHILWCTAIHNKETRHPISLVPLSPIIYISMVDVMYTSKLTSFSNYVTPNNKPKRDLPCPPIVVYLHLIPYNLTGATDTREKVGSFCS